MFAVNIAGVLADAQIIDQTTYSWEWDENWEAKTTRTKRGWSAEIRIPLRVLRFDSKLPVQSWGFQASRFIAQRQETDLWTYVPRDVAAPIAFYGRLDGLGDLRGAGALELQPFVLASGQRRDASQTAVGSGTSGSASAGLDLKWHIAQDLTFDAALNPDFSQVELDQIILNLGTYETFLPEKRPFFLEGIDAFSFPMQVFYSRRIGSAPVAPSLRSDASSNEELVNVPDAGDDLRRGKAGRPPQPQLDDRGAQRAHRRQRRHHLRQRQREDQPAGGAGHRVQRAAPQARARQRRPHRPHRHRLDDVREQRRLPPADRQQRRELCPSGATPVCRQPLFPRRLRRRPRRPLALTVGRLRRQRRVHRVVHPRRADRHAARRDADRLGRGGAGRLAAGGERGGQAPHLERGVHRRRAAAQLQRPRLHAAAEHRDAAGDASAGGRWSRASTRSTPPAPWSSRTAATSPGSISGRATS